MLWNPCGNRDCGSSIIWTTFTSWRKNKEQGIEHSHQMVNHFKSLGFLIKFSEKQLETTPHAGTTAGSGEISSAGDITLAESVLVAPALTTFKGKTHGSSNLQGVGPG